MSQSGQSEFGREELNDRRNAVVHRHIRHWLASRAPRQHIVLVLSKAGSHDVSTHQRLP